MRPDEHFAARCAQAACRACGERGLRPVIDLGAMPLADALLTDEQLGRPEERRQDKGPVDETAVLSTAALVHPQPFRTPRDSADNQRVTGFSPGTVR